MVNISSLSELIWISIIAYSMVQGYLLFLLFPTYRQGSKQAKWLLSLASLLCAILLTEKLLGIVIGYDDLPHLIFSVSPLWYLLGPIIFFYIRLHTTNRKVLLRDFWHLLPMLWVLFSTLEFYLLDGEIKLHYLSIAAQGATHPIHRINFIIFSSQSIFYLVKSYYLMKKVTNLPRKRSEHIWILQLVFGLGIIAVMSFFTLFIMNSTSHYDIWWSDSIYFIFVSGFLLALFVNSTRSQKELYIIGKSPFSKSKDSRAQFEPLYQELIHFLKEHRPYTDPEYDLHALSKQFGHSKHYISKMIKETSGQNFRDFINQYRLEEAKKKLSSSQSKHFTIQSIANDSGFTSLATFYRAFKKMEGKPPKSFIG